MFHEPSLSLIDQLTGDRVSTMTVIGGGLIGSSAPGVLQFGGAQLILAQATTAGAIPLPGSGGITMPEVLPNGTLRIAGGLITAAMVLDALQDRAERAQVMAAIERFGLDADNAVHILGARAYVWGRNMAPLSYWSVPFRGDANEAVARALMAHEMANPTTLALAVRGNRSAKSAIDLVVETALAGGSTAATPQVFARTSKVDPALSTSSSTARTLLGISSNAWRAHHLIPFAVVAAMPLSSQQAIAASGWRMDSLENLIALPANLATYLAAPNLGTLPYHNSAHPIYSAAAASHCAAISAGAPAMGAGPLRAALLAVETTMSAYLLQRLQSIHPQLK